MADLQNPRHLRLAVGVVGNAQRRPERRARIPDGVVAFAGAADLVAWGGSSELVGGGVLPLWVVPVFSVGFCALLLVRHRYPVGVWGAQWAFAGVNLLIPSYYPFAYLLVAVYAVASRRPASVAGRVLAGSIPPFVLFSYHAAVGRPDASEMDAFLVAAAIWTVFLSVAWGFGRLVYARDQHASAEQARITADAEQALVAQRLRLARELHDSVSGTVAGIVLYAGAARAVGTDIDPHTHRVLEAIEKAGTHAITELHTLLGLLRSDPTGHPPKRLDTLEELIELAGTGGVTVDLIVTGTPPPTIDPDIDLTAYRVVQESLTNTTKHAGHGAAARIGIIWSADTVTVAVTSSGGHGPSPTAGDLSSGHGLRGLHQRVQDVGGHMESGPTDLGWRVHTELPLTTPQHPARQTK